MREWRAQVTLPGEPEAAELSQGQSLERSPSPAGRCSTHAHTPGICFTARGKQQPSLQQASHWCSAQPPVFPGTWTAQKTHLQLQMIHHYHQHQRSCLNVPPKLARGQSVTSASPNRALCDTALDGSLCQYSWLLFLLGKNSCLALKYCILQ